MVLIRNLSALGVLLGCLAGPMTANSNDEGKFTLTDQKLDAVSAGVAVSASARGGNIALAFSGARSEGPIGVGAGISAACCGAGSSSNVSTSGGNGSTVTTRLPFASVSAGVAVDVKKLRVGKFRIRR